MKKKIPCAIGGYDVGDAAPGRLYAQCLFEGGGVVKENKFKAARKRLGLTQKKLSEVLDIPKRTIEDWEGGRRNPPEWVKKLVLERMESMKQ